MLYYSTRNTDASINSAEAIKQGISPDGGLFIPTKIPVISDDEIKKLAGLSYQERAKAILKFFLTDYSDTEISDCVEKAYAADKFSSNQIAPLTKLSDETYILELWHGPTCAFKDMALQILPQFLTKSMQKTGETKEIAILVATSGDTGKAALEGFADVAKTKIVVFYPENGVSEVQKYQMITQEGKNVGVVAVRGNFDDTQNGVKRIFTDANLNKELDSKNIALSSANSINWGRLVPQIIYYFSAYADLLKNNQINYGEKINVVVPTGNFGNILAAFYAKEMGLPLEKLICASNANNVLTDFIKDGIYDRKREFFQTLSPSMDILISSNLERLLFEISGHSADTINDLMEQLKTLGKYEIPTEMLTKIREHFSAGYADDSQTIETIKEVYDAYRYLLDTHTAVGYKVYKNYIEETGDNKKTIIASTASPFKFNSSVVKAILSPDEIKDKDEFELLELLSSKTGLAIPNGLKGLKEKNIRHKINCEKEQMDELVLSLLAKL